MVDIVLRGTHMVALEGAVAVGVIRVDDFGPLRDAVEELVLLGVKDAGCEVEVGEDPCAGDPPAHSAVDPRRVLRLDARLAHH